MKTIIIAEAGVNHNGSLNMAKMMVDAAAKAKVDYIKFQTFKSEKLVSRFAEQADYQKENLKSSEGDGQLSMLKELELSYDDFRELKAYTETTGVGFLSTPFDLDSIDFLESLDMDYWKLPSGEITNLPYLEKIANSGRPVIMSTGMADMDEVRAAVKVLNPDGKRDITILQCNTMYPTEPCDVNLRAMKELASLGYPVGYSDHTRGIHIPVAAVAMGATVIEKHFTLDRSLPGPDHIASLEPSELEEMVRNIRDVELALGDGVKGPSKSESPNKKAARKSLVAACQIKAGEVFTVDNLSVKRPGDGISPMKYHDLIGKKAKNDYIEDQQIKEEEL